MYQEFFGLCSTPFDLNTDPRFLYLSPEHARARAYLDYAVYKGDSLVVITGEIGVGKSTLIHDLTDRIDKNTEVVVMHHPHNDTVEFLQAMLLSWGHEFPATTKPELLKQIQSELNARFTWGTRTTLIIDEAQTLTCDVLEELRHLADQEIDSQKPLGIVLIGQPCLNDTLAGPEMEQLRQRIRLSFHLPALDEHETKGYIERRLGVSGATGRFPVFLNETIPRIYKYTGGIPRLINVLADLSLTAAWMDGNKYVSAIQVNNAIKELGWMPYSRRMLHMPTLPLVTNLGGQLRLANDRAGQTMLSYSKLAALKTKHTVASLIAGAERIRRITWTPLSNWTRYKAIPGARKKVAISRLVMQSKQRQLLSRTKETSRKVMKSIRAPSPEDGWLNPSSVRGVLVGFAAAMVFSAAMLLPTSGDRQNISFNEQKIGGSDSGDYVRPELSYASLGLFSSHEQLSPLLVNDATPIVGNELIPPANIALRLKHSQAGTGYNSPYLIQEINFGSSAVTPAYSAYQLQSSAAVNDLSDTLLSGLQPKEWVLAQNPNTYIIQILAAKKREVVDRFLQDLIADLDIAYYRKQRNQEEWYVLVSGVYDSYASAKSASMSLPDQARKAKPWIRPIADVQRDILQASTFVNSGSW